MREIALHDSFSTRLLTSEFLVLQVRGTTTFAKLRGSNFLVSGITASLQEIFLERYSQFGAVFYPHQTPTKELRKKFGGGGFVKFYS